MLRNNRFSHRRGFTLVEVLLVSLMIGVIAIALYQALSNGLQIWEHTRNLSIEEDLIIFFDRLAMDLRNAHNFSLFEFEAETDRIVFSTIISVPMGQVGSRDVEAYSDQIGRVEYGLDTGLKAIYRRYAHYGQAVEGSFGDKTILARPILRMTWKYFQRGERGISEQKLDRMELPAAIEVSIDYLDSQKQTRTLTRMINVPLFL